MRCGWAGEDPLMVAYHDEEWGVPVHDDRTLFEFLALEGAQAGLSWNTILNKREHYRAAFDRFDPRLIALYSARKFSNYCEIRGSCAQNCLDDRKCEGVSAGTIR